VLAFALPFALPFALASDPLSVPDAYLWYFYSMFVRIFYLEPYLS
jgi:hypothetical protein